MLLTQAIPQKKSLRGAKCVYRLHFRLHLEIHIHMYM